ncbi:DUF2931 family protein [Vibrio sp. PP-XX7]
MLNSPKSEIVAKPRKIRKSLHARGLWAIVSAAISGCASAVPEDMPAWQIVIATPSFYSVGISTAYGVNKTEDWTALTHGFSQLSNWNGLKNARKWILEYDGFGMPLNPFVNIDLADKLAVAPTICRIVFMSIYRTSYIGQTKFYAARYDVPDTIKQFMRTKRSYIRRDGVKRPCYKSNFVFGLLQWPCQSLVGRLCYIYLYLRTSSSEREPDKGFQWC